MPLHALAQREGQRCAVLAPFPRRRQFRDDRIEPILRDIGLALVRVGLILVPAVAAERWLSLYTHDLPDMLGLLIRGSLYSLIALLLLILGSSPMIEGIPAFFAAGKYGIGLIAIMAIVFALSTIATYMLFCVYSTAGLQRLRLGAFERYGEVLSGAFIALVGLAFWIWPIL